MAQAGDIYTFTALFLDGLNTPIVVNNPTIEVFAFDSEGNKIDLVPSGTPMVSVVAEVGRYYYTYPISSSCNLLLTSSKNCNFFSVDQK